MQSLHVRYHGTFRYDEKAASWAVDESVRVSRAVLLAFTQSRRRWARALGPDWRYRGTLGLQQDVHTYRRERSEPFARPVAIPSVRRGEVRLVPGADSEMEFKGPQKLVYETSPAGTRSTAGGLSTIAVGVAGRLDDVDRSTVEVFPEDGESFWDRLFSSALGLLGLAITTAVTVAVTIWVTRRLSRGRGATRTE